jgi:hypothetical protein
MYCPTCSSQNDDGLKYCTRCGTNLGVVSDALSGKFDGKLAAKDPMIELLTKYYDGRRSTAVGVGSMLIGLLVLAVCIKLSLPENLTGVLLNGVAACALIYGAIAIIAGIAEWIQSSSKMKAMNHPALQKSLPDTAPNLKLPPSKEYDTAPTAEPIQAPVAVSVTEQTTRQLEERLHEVKGKQ